MTVGQELDLYQLLPTMYRTLDAEQGEPLRALLEIVRKQASLIRDNIGELWDDFFIETCEQWVIPYIGDLVANNPLHGMARGPRADVAKTIYYRRRKGTLPVLEEIARDVTHWRAHAVPFFELLGWTQNVNHLRIESEDSLHPLESDRVGTVNLRNLDALDRLDGPFDTSGHTVDVRPFGIDNGRHNIRKVGFFLWPIGEYPWTHVEARQVEGQSKLFHFSPLGNPAPLLTNPAPEAEDTGLAVEMHVPGVIRALAFDRNPDRYYGEGPDKSLAVYVDESLVPVAKIEAADLRAWTLPDPGKVAVDFLRGRLAFGTTPAGTVSVSFFYGFGADLGGGPYDRRARFENPRGKLVIPVREGGTPGTLQQALVQWALAGKPPCLVRVEDNGIYGGTIAVSLPANGSLTIEAAERRRPIVRLVAPMTIAAPAEGARVRLHGLLIEGELTLSGNLSLEIDHCTLVPGKTLREDGEPEEPELDSIEVSGDPATGLQVRITNSVVGPIRLPAEVKHLSIEDSIVQAPLVHEARRWAIAADDTGLSPGPRATLQRATVFGPVRVRELAYASEVIFADAVRVDRLQRGCVRFSYVPWGSRTPRRYRCQPDEEVAAAAGRKEKERGTPLSPLEQEELGQDVARWLVPQFLSTRYGDPEYGILHPNCPEQIRHGAENGSEMGAFSALSVPQREANLRIRLDEYLPLGLEPGLLRITLPRGD